MVISCSFSYSLSVDGTFDNDYEISDVACTISVSLLGETALQVAYITVICLPDCHCTSVVVNSDMRSYRSKTV